MSDVKYHGDRYECAMQTISAAALTVSGPPDLSPGRYLFHISLPPVHINITSRSQMCLSRVLEGWHVTKNPISSPLHERWCVHVCVYVCVCVCVTILLQQLRSLQWCVKEVVRVLCRSVTGLKNKKTKPN